MVKELATLPSALRTDLGRQERERFAVGGTWLDKQKSTEHEAQSTYRARRRKGKSTNNKGQARGIV